VQRGVIFVNEQKPERIVNDTLTLEVNSIFDTIQGEGPFAGSPATFVRLAGCNLACTWCDTEYTTRTTMYVTDVVARCSKRLVVITGGEPLRQSIAPLCVALKHAGHAVQIETNGTIFRQDVIDSGAVIVISPKTQSIDKRFLLCYNNEDGVILFKMIYGPAFPAQPEGKGGNPWDTDTPRDYVMPLDTGDEATSKAIAREAAQYCIDNDLRLTLQTHKWLGIP
jgi:7-carboxy-7-deazaguanine synthase